MELKYDFLIVYMSLMIDNVDVSIGIDRVTYVRLSCPYVLLECYCTFDKRIMCVSLLVYLCPST